MTKQENPLSLHLGIKIHAITRKHNFLVISQKLNKIFQLFHKKIIKSTAGDAVLLVNE